MEIKTNNERCKEVTGDQSYPWHGFLGRNRDWEAPRKTQHCDEEARPGYQTVKAHEYEDSDEVLNEKVLMLADLITRAANCLVYSGAGLSTSSGISDYATKSGTKFAEKKSSGFSAQPTFAHKALVTMQQAGLVRHWVQQNHDGLPQKAGLPQHCLNEIHGAWYDPSNPVVPMSGSLRQDLFADMLAWEQRADLTLSVGTSMCGMNSDRVFTTVAEKSLVLHERQWGTSSAQQTSSHMRSKRRSRRSMAADKDGSSSQPPALGGVILGIQQTQYDGLACLHLFARVDRVMQQLLAALGLDVDRHPPANLAPHHFPSESVLSPGRFLVRYDSLGRLCAGEVRAVLDLRPGSRVTMTSGPYQGDSGVVLGQTAEGHFQLEFVHTLDYRNSCTVEPYRMRHVLGSWFVLAAAEGSLPAIPVVNCKLTSAADPTDSIVCHKATQHK